MWISVATNRLIIAFFFVYNLVRVDRIKLSSQHSSGSTTINFMELRSSSQRQASTTRGQLADTHAATATAAANAFIVNSVCCSVCREYCHDQHLPFATPLMQLNDWLVSRRGRERERRGSKRRQLKSISLPPIRNRHSNQPGSQSSDLASLHKAHHVDQLIYSYYHRNRHRRVNSNSSSSSSIINDIHFVYDKYSYLKTKRAKLKQHATSVSYQSSSSSSSSLVSFSWTKPRSCSKQQHRTSI